MFRAIATYEPGVDYFNEVSSVYATEQTLNDDEWDDIGDWSEGDSFLHKSGAGNFSKTAPSVCDIHPEPDIVLGDLRVLGRELTPSSDPSGTLRLSRRLIAGAGTVRFPLMGRRT